MLDSTSVSTLLLLGAASALLLAAMLYPSSFLRWLQRKRYQYEVTFSLYMLTPTEKFVFNSVLFILVALLVIAASLYLPEHVTVMANRVVYYFLGDEAPLSKGAAPVLKSTTKLMHSAATQFLGRENANQRLAEAGGLAGAGRAYMDA